MNALARAAGVPPRRVNEIVLGKRGVTVDTAVHLAAALQQRGQVHLIPISGGLNKGVRFI